MTSRWLPIAVSALLLLQACVHEMIPIPPPPKPPVQSGSGDSASQSSFYTNGVWQATIDGVSYSGSIDTSWTVYDSSFMRIHPDSMIYCTGTSSDKRANVHFQININRFLTGIPNISTIDGAEFSLDTGTVNMLDAWSSSQSTVEFYIDSVSGTIVRGHFSGTLSVESPTNGISDAGGHTVTNGTFTAGWHGRGVVQNGFVFTGPTSGAATGIKTVNGYFNSASLSSNTLYLDGAVTDISNQSRYRMQLRTGGTIKPGTYTSANGDAGMVLYMPSIDREYITDSVGSLTVTITKVSGDVVYGNFSGSDFGAPVSNGSFAARIKNYVPEADSADKWGFGAFSIGMYEPDYYIYGGNVLNAALTNAAGRYYLTVNGESDFGASAFKFVISSANPIAAGSYTMAPYAYQGTIDSFYYRSSMQLPSITDAANTTVQIDSIDAHHVWGQLKGGVNGYSNSLLQVGKFSASY